MIKIDLEVLGFTDTETSIYLALLDNPNLSAKEIQEAVGISQARVYDCLMNLVQGKPGIGGLIDFRTEGKKRIYYPIDPRTNLQQLREVIIETITAETQKAVDEITKRYTLSSEKGFCSKYSGFRTYRYKDTSLKFMKEVIFSAKEQIVFNAFPTWVLKEIRFEINQVARNVQTRVYIDPGGTRDNYVLSLFSPEVEIFALTNLEKLPFYVDDEEWERAEILIDKKILIGVSYDTEAVDITVTSFTSPGLVLGILESLSKIRNKLKRGEKLKKGEISIRSLLRDKPLTKREIAEATGLSGSELNSIIDGLCNKGIVRVKKEKIGKGRPRMLVQLVDNAS